MERAASPQGQTPTAALAREAAWGRARRWALWWRLVRSKPLGAAGGLLVVGMVLLALGAPLIAPFDPEKMQIGPRLAPPGGAFLFGTDRFGRDVFSRIVWGSRVSMTVGLGAVGTGIFLGGLLGLLSGYFRGRTDFFLQRLLEILQAFPMLVLAMVIVAVLGPSVTNVIVALAAVQTPTANRVVRSAVLSVREFDYVEAARAIGCGHSRILWHHILPNVAAPIIVLASIYLGLTILVESSLSFLGLGPPPPAPTWGGMLSGEGRALFEQAPWLAIYPGVAISLGVLGFNLFGDALRDIWDPRLRGTA